MAALETKEYTTQLRLAVAAELTTITIRKRYLELVQILKEKSLLVQDQVIQDDLEEEIIPDKILQVVQTSHA
jgi:transcription initiation factor TFIIB